MKTIVVEPGKAVVVTVRKSSLGYRSRGKVVLTTPQGQTAEFFNGKFYQYGAEFTIPANQTSSAPFTAEFFVARSGSNTFEKVSEVSVVNPEVESGGDGGGTGGELSFLSEQAVLNSSVLARVDLDGFGSSAPFVPNYFIGGERMLPANDTTQETAIFNGETGIYTVAAAFEFEVYAGNPNIGQMAVLGITVGTELYSRVKNHTIENGYQKVEIEFICVLHKGDRVLQSFVYDSDTPFPVSGSFILMPLLV